MKLAAILGALMLLQLGGAQVSAPDIPISLRHTSIPLALDLLQADSGKKIEVRAAHTDGFVDFSDKLPFEKLLERILAFSVQKLRYRLEGDTYIVEYAEPVISVEAQGKTVGVVLADVFGQADTPYEIEHLDEKRIISKMPAFKNVSLSIFLDEFLLKLDPKAWYRVEDDGHYRIFPFATGGKVTISGAIRHSGAVRQISLSEGSTKIATSDEHGRTIVWSNAQGSIIAGINGIIGRNAFTEGGRELIYASDRSVMAYAFADRSNRTIATLKSTIHQIAFAPKGSLVVAEDGKELVAYNSQTGVRLWPASSKGGDVLFDLDQSGSKLALVYRAKSAQGRWTVFLLDAKHYRNPTHFSVDAKPASLFFNPDGSNLFVTTEGGRTWSYSTVFGGDPTPWFEQDQKFGRGESVASVSEDGNRLIMSVGGRDVVVRDARTTKSITSLSAPANNFDPVTSVAIDSKGQNAIVARMSFGGNTPTISSYNLSTRRENRQFRSDAGSISFLQFSSDGHSLVIGDDTSFRVLNLSHLGVPLTIQGRNVVVRPHLRANERVVVFGVDPSSQKLTYWLMPEGVPVPFDAPLETKGIAEVRWSGDGKWIALRRSSGVIEVWPFGGRTCVTIKPPELPIRRMVVNERLDRIALLSGQKETFVSLWNATSGQQIGTSVKLAGGGQDLVIASRGNFAAYSAAGTTHGFNIFNGQGLFDIPGDQPSFSPTGTSVAVRDSGKIVTYNTITGKQTILGRGQEPDWSHGSGIVTWLSEDQKTVNVSGPRVHARISDPNSTLQCVAVDPNGKFVVTGGDDGIVRFWTSDGKPLVWTRFYGKQVFIVVRGNRYMATVEAARKQKFTLAGKSYPFDQFDLQLNRPEEILQALSTVGLSTEAEYAFAKEARRKRLERFGFNEESIGQVGTPPDEPSPTSPIPTSTTLKTIHLNLTLFDTLVTLDRLKISVNGVPWPTSQGILLRDRKLRDIKFPCDIPLSRGRNVLRISVVNAQGAESTKLVHEVQCEASPASRPNLYLLAVGERNVPNHEVLDYVASDARRIGTTFASLASVPKTTTFKKREKRRRGRHWIWVTKTGSRTTRSSEYGAIYTHVLDQSPTRKEILAQREFLAKANENDVVVVYLSGHGELANGQDFCFLTSDYRAEDMAGTSLSYDAIESMVDGLRARKRIILLDACKSGLRDKITARDLEGQGINGLINLPDADGVTRSFSRMVELFSNLENSTGSTIVAATGGSASAQQISELQGSAFALAIVKGIRDRLADYDGDRHIRVSELRRYVFAEVPRLTHLGQKPSSRAENPEVDFDIR